jgi:hypothetical protein
MKVLVIYERRTGELVALMRPTGPAPLESRDGHPEQVALPLPGQVAAELEVPSEHADRDLLEIAARYRVAVGRTPALVLHGDGRPSGAKAGRPRSARSPRSARPRPRGKGRGV